MLISNPLLFSSRLMFEKIYRKYYITIESESEYTYIYDKIGKLAQIKSDVFAHSGIK